jgi:hypothetical protein
VTLTRDEFEAIAGKLGQLEDCLLDARRAPFLTQSDLVVRLDAAIQLAIAVHAQAQLLLEPAVRPGVSD